MVLVTVAAESCNYYERDRLLKEREREREGEGEILTAEWFFLRILPNIIMHKYAHAFKNKWSL